MAESLDELALRNDESARQTRAAGDAQIASRLDPRRGRHQGVLG
jgi:hypothetical protein